MTERYWWNEVITKFSFSGRMDSLSAEMDTLYRVAATAPFYTALQTLALLLQVLESRLVLSLELRFHVLNSIFIIFE